MQSKTIEVAVGLFIALAVAALLMLAMKVSDITGIGEDKGYRISASFENVGGLKVRSPVSVAGVRVGRVAAIAYDPSTYEAVVEMSINPAYNQLPTDTSASILTSGLLGEQYVGLEPGGMDEALKEGDRIKLTQSALVLERLIGQFLFDKAGESN